MTNRSILLSGALLSFSMAAEYHLRSLPKMTLHNDKPDGWYRKFDKPRKNRNLKR